MELQDWVGPLPGGAVGAALINAFFGWHKQRFDQEDEHRRWIRNQKPEAYIDYLESSRIVHNLTAGNLTTEKRERLNEVVNRVRSSPIRLLAPQDVVTAFDEVQKLTYAFTSGGPLAELGRDVVADADRPRAEEARLRLSDLCRADLRATEARKRRPLRKKTRIEQEKA